jgi:hypothetical protein
MIKKTENTTTKTELKKVSAPKKESTFKKKKKV